MFSMLPSIDPSWQGEVEFHELLFGTWLAYIFLVWMWEKGLQTPLDEWKYFFITYFGSSFFLVNHYFMKASLWMWAINGYTVLFMVVYYKLTIPPSASSTTKFMCAFSSIPFSMAYMVFEVVARKAVDHGCHEFWIMLLAYLGFLGIFFWRVPNHKQVKRT